MALFIQCGITNPQPATGTISGVYTVTLQDNEIKHYEFEENNISYGYIEFYYEDHTSWEELTISAPYGIQEGTGNVAPSGNYTLTGVDIILGSSYFIRPDSLHYGKVEIEGMINKAPVTIRFNWILQTEPENRELYL